MSIHPENTQTSPENHLPPPPYGKEVDLKRFPYLPLHAQPLRDSEFVMLASGDEFRAHVLLLLAAWHQIPAGSLPIDDRFLCALAKTDKKTWGKIKNIALHGFVLHADQRLYHPVLTEIAKASWSKMRGNTERTAAATAAAALAAAKKKELDGSRNGLNDGNRYGSNDGQRNGNQEKRSELNGIEINGVELKKEKKESPRQQTSGGGGAFHNSNQIGLGEMLTGCFGFENPALLAALSAAAAGATHQQLDCAAAAIKKGAHKAEDLAAWSMTLARLASRGMVTAPAAALETPELNLKGKDGWVIKGIDCNDLKVDFGMLRGPDGILGREAMQAVAAGLASGELHLLQPQ